ncbi:MAG: hypothetical protein AB1659_13605 [Thermodesulfobacteriota bacterium]
MVIQKLKDGRWACYYRICCKIENPGRSGNISDKKPAIIDRFLSY